MLFIQYTVVAENIIDYDKKYWKLPKSNLR